MDLQQTPVLLMLENDLVAALETAQSAHEAILAQMDASRHTITQLLQNEAVETALYVDNTHLHMRALRDVVALEMDRARRDVAAFLKNATHNATLSRNARDHTRTLTRTKLAALHARRREQESEWQQEIERVKTTAAREAARLQAEGMQIPVRSNPLLPAAAVAAQETNAITTAVQLMPTDPVWVVPFLVSLVIGACLWVMLSAWRARRAAAERRRRILYSAQLKRHFATIDVSIDRKTAGTKPESPRSPASFDRRPTLQRRMRPSWSPAASTASTVSSPDLPTSVFSTHAAFQSTTPSPFN